MHGRRLGGPKSLAELGPFKDEDVDRYVAGMEQMLQQGQPMEVPAAMPTGDLCRLAYTLKVRGDRIKELEAEVAALTPAPEEAPLPDLLGSLFPDRVPVKL